MFKHIKTGFAKITVTVKEKLPVITDKLSLVVKKAVKDAEVDIPKLKEYSVLALTSVLGFLLATAKLPQNIYPFGIAAMVAFSDKKKTLFVYAGAALACVTYGNSALSSFIIYFMLYAARKTFTDSSFSEGLHIRLLESALTSMAVGIIRICTGTEAPVYSYIAFVSLACLSCTFTYFFTTLFTPELRTKAKMSTLSICSYALMGAIVCALDGYTLFGFDLQLTVACIITLTYAVVNGFLHAGIVGFVCGIACANPLISACLGVCGIICSFTVSKSIVAAVIAFAAAFFVAGAYSSGLTGVLTLLPSAAAACVMFFPLCGFLPDSLRLTVSADKKDADGMNTVWDSDYRKKLSEAFFSLSDIFSKLADKQRYPSYNDVSACTDKVFAEVCAGCALSEMCYAKKKTDIDDLKQTLFSALSSRAAVPEDFGANMKDKCIRLDSLCDRLNTVYRQIAVDLAKDNRTSLLSAQYAGMARLMIDTEKRIVLERARDTAFEKNVRKALDDIDVPFCDVVVTSGREKKTRVGGINIDKIPFGAKELKKYIFAKCGTKISEPSFDISEKNDIVMSFEKSPVISVRYSQACAAKEDEAVCGDTVNFIHSDKNYFYSLICDGMGSGRDAAASSRLASLFLENMLLAGTKKTVILELLNNVLMSRSGENFSTVDLFEADLLDGRCTFIKAGAAPTYILRDSKLYKIFSATPPVGIISGFTAESTRFDVIPGDVVIMMSDGVVQNNEDSEWLSELIRVDTSKDPSVLAKSILDKSSEINAKADDMSVCVIKIENAL